MPLVANTDLPSFARLESEGSLVIPRDTALSQEVRELHIGLLNMMPDKALEATERQFFRLVGESNQIARFYLHPFTLEELQRSREGREHVESYYKRFDEIQADGLDALIITGANVVDPALDRQEFWDPLIEVVDWAPVGTSLPSCVPAWPPTRYCSSVTGSAGSRCPTSAGAYIRTGSWTVRTPWWPA